MTFLRCRSCSTFFTSWIFKEYTFNVLDTLSIMHPNTLVRRRKTIHQKGLVPRGITTKCNLRHHLSLCRRITGTPSSLFRFINRRPIAYRELFCLNDQMSISAWDCICCVSLEPQSFVLNMKQYNLAQLCYTLFNVEEVIVRVEAVFQRHDNHRTKKTSYITHSLRTRYAFIIWIFSPYQLMRAL